jgi:ABC-2 type transport system permease protein
MSTVFLHARLWWLFVQLDAMLLVEYRVSFVFGVVRQVASLALTVWGVGLLYQYTESIAGWSRPELLLLLGVFWIFSGAWDVLLEGLQQVSGDVHYGRMDFVLLRPVSAQFYLSLRRVSLLDVLNVAMGVGLVAYAGGLAGISWHAGNVVVALVLGTCGLVAIYALRFIVVTSVFWLTGVDNIDAILHPVFQVGQYPVDFFKGWIRPLLTFVVPVAFATTFPAQALLGTVDARLVPAGLVLAVMALYASHRSWLYAVRHYTSISG